MMQTVQRVLEKSNIERQGENYHGNTFVFMLLLAIFFKLFSLILFYMWGYFACMCDSRLYAGSTNGGQKKVSGLLELE